MITSSSRYRNSAVVPLPFGTDPYTSDVRNTIVATAPADFTFTFTLHVVTGGERIEQIAAHYYGDATLWWWIGHANRDKALNWAELTPGMQLRIPSV